MGTVLFVCVENTFRSVLSEELFNSKASPGWHAESAGVSPTAAVNSNVRQLLSEVGIAMTEKVPRAVTKEMVDRAARVVTFGCLDRCPIGAEGKAEDWTVPGAAGKSIEELRTIRDELFRRVDDLISRLSKLDIEILRRELVKTAQARETFTYGQLMKLLGISRGRPLLDAISEVDKAEYAKGAPGFAAIIVRKDTGYPGGGFFCDDDLPPALRRPYSRASESNLSAAEMNYVRGAQKKIWDYYSAK